MTVFLQRHWFKLVAAVILIVIAAALLSQQLQRGKSEYKIIQQAPSFNLTNMDGNQVNWQDSKGKVRLVFFFFSYCPDVCTPTTYLMSRVQDDLINQGYWGNKAAFFSITFDPDRDTPERLQQFSSQFTKHPADWFFVRGEEKATFDLAKQFGIAVGKDKDGNFLHTNLIVLVDKNNNIRNYYDAGSIDPKVIVKDMVQLSKQ
jgi:protein SCO1/2